MVWASFRALNCPVCHARIADDLGVRRFAPKFYQRRSPVLEAIEYESIIDPHPNRGHRASRSVERPPRAPIAAAGTTNRSPATRQSLRRGAPALLRQNAAVMLLEVRLKTVWNRSLTAIGYVNLDFHLDFREFNI